VSAVGALHSTGERVGREVRVEKYPGFGLDAADPLDFGDRLRL
jgi:hypothetical protein